MDPKSAASKVRMPLDETVAIENPDSPAVPGQPVPLEFAALPLPGYRIVSLLGKGGMGLVLLARQLELDRYVAVKMLSPKFGRSKESLDRLHAEAKALASLNHPNIVACHDIVRDGERLLVIMDYVPGRLSVEELSEKYGALPETHAASIVRQTARGLSYCHGKGIIHRDIKPSNLLVFHDCDEAPDSVGALLAREHTRIMIADFGIAKSDQHADGDATVEGQVMGTPAFMSPEQAEGKAVDHRTDIYALGATFFRLLTGRNPFSADTPQEALKLRLTTDLPDIRDLDTSITDACAHVLGTMTARDPAERYQDYHELLDDLDTLVGRISAQRSTRSIRRRPKAKLWFAAILLALLAFAGWLLFAGKQTAPDLSTSLRYWSGADGAWQVAPPDDATEGTLALVCQIPGEMLTLDRPVPSGSDLRFSMRLPGTGQMVAAIISDGQRVWELQWTRDREGDQIRAGPVGKLSPFSAIGATQPTQWKAVRIRTSPSQVLLYLDETLADYQQTEALAGDLQLAFELREGHLVQFKDIRIISPEDRQDARSASERSR
jgi:serine/threonine protein kinase